MLIKNNTANPSSRRSGKESKYIKLHSEYWKPLFINLYSKQKLWYYPQIHSSLASRAGLLTKLTKNKELYLEVKSSFYFMKLLHQHLI